MQAGTINFQELLVALMSPNNDIRRQAEQLYEHRMSTTSESVATLHELLVILSNTGCDLTIRSLAGILMRRSVSKIVASLPVELINQLKSSLLVCHSFP
jgi:hypothetical protein